MFHSSKGIDRTDAAHLHPHNVVNENGYPIQTRNTQLFRSVISIMFMIFCYAELDSEPIQNCTLPDTNTLSDNPSHNHQLYPGTDRERIIDND